VTSEKQYPLQARFQVNIVRPPQDHVTNTVPLFTNIVKTANIIHNDNGKTSYKSINNPSMNTLYSLKKKSVKYGTIEVGKCRFVFSRPTPQKKGV